MLNAAAAEFERDATGASLAKLGHALGDQVTQTCNRIVSGRYPFTRNGRDVGEVPMVDFGRLFAPRGILDRFFAENLASFADQSGAQWSWRQDSLIARRLSPATLREFQRAAEIRDAFFQNGGNVPSIVMAVQPLTLSGEGANAKLEINETSIAPVQGISTPVNLQWPGSGMAGLGRTSLTLNRGLATPPAVIEEQGAWSLYRMLDRAQIRPQRNGIVARFSVEGHEVLYQFTVSAISNPLTLPALHEFRCPSGI
jgi:type VI secretion system protein ImpL